MNWGWPKIWAEEKGGWWRVIMTLALSALGVVAGILLGTQIQLSGLKEFLKNEPAHVQEIGPLIVTLMVTGLGLAGCLIGIRFVHRKPIAQVFTDGRPFGMGLAVQSALIWAVLWFGFTLPLPGAWDGMVRRTHGIPLGWWPILIVATLLAMTMGRATEEVLFRGYLQTRLAAWVKRPWLAVGLVSVGFSMVHQGNPAAKTVITLFGMVWGTGCIRAGTLAPMIGAHVLHDALNVLLLPRDQVNDANARTTWFEAGLVAVALLLWLGWLWWATRRRAPAEASGLDEMQANRVKPAKV